MKSLGITGGVYDRVADIFVAQIILYQAGIIAALSEAVSTGMPKHMWVYPDWKLCGGSILPHQRVDALARKALPCTGDKQPGDILLSVVWTYGQPVLQQAVLFLNDRMDSIKTSF